MFEGGRGTPDEERQKRYWLCAELWGWSPEQVDKMDLADLEALLYLNERKVKKEKAQREFEKMKMRRK